MGFFQPYTHAFPASFMKNHTFPIIAEFSVGTLIKVKVVKRFAFSNLKIMVK
ncbi:hypothetical protein B4096_3436 [Heyndrickxia coagulans]|uniref:Uncharacterized protein n=1 Tax=Heyndrickxia coagulans TaxID=1398 RepID=A0AAN0T598_HEYCO|nr:hypothetical protein SB48_HM08orf03722 [Heyndrickxia coagulans]KYC59048.1 hypothetical protein B4100_3549 [Heyndrickxia coagulans]KYC88456.1 hypothetical protein B4096_3436 [Heyndrickxia coagulans]